MIKSALKLIDLICEHIHYQTIDLKPNFTSNVILYRVESQILIKIRKSILYFKFIDNNPYTYLNKFVR